MYDVAVVGSGFGGSILAMIARRLGRSVVLVEKGTHPRFTIGESSTPLANLMLDQLAAGYDLPSLAPFAKWGTWQHTYPDVACGLKRGFTFFHHDLDNPTCPLGDRERQLLVAASPHDEIADTHWFRADFDRRLVEEARKLGVEYRDKTELTSFHEAEDHVELAGQGTTIRARAVIDATGPRGFLHRALSLEELAFPNYPATQAIYAHFRGVESFADSLSEPPYPPDAAAVHHVFEGGWIWVLRFNHGVTSAGAATIGEPPEWDDLLARIPSLRDRFAGATSVDGFHRIRSLPFRSARIAGPRWALLPSAAGFVDPLLSTGFPLTLLGIERLAKLLEQSQTDFEATDYAEQTEKDLLAAADLVSALYSAMSNFPLFRSLALLYFAAVIFSETAWRLGKRELAGSFLLRDDPEFGPAMRSIAERARTNPIDSLLMRDIEAAVAPLDVAGLLRPERRHWHPFETPTDCARLCMRS